MQKDKHNETLVSPIHDHAVLIHSEVLLHGVLLKDEEKREKDSHSNIALSSSLIPSSPGSYSPPFPSLLFDVKAAAERRQL